MSEPLIGGLIVVAVLLFVAVVAVVGRWYNKRDTTQEQAYRKEFVIAADDLLREE